MPDDPKTLTAIEAVGISHLAFRIRHVAVDNR